MRYFLFVCILLQQPLVFGQVDSIQLNRYHSAFVEFAPVYTRNNIDEQFEYRTLSYGVGGSLGLLEGYKLNIEGNLNFKYIPAYARQADIGSFIDHPNLDEQSPYNYWGWNMGPALYFGGQHQLELSFLLGFGRYNRTDPFIKRVDMDATVRTGYRYISNQGWIINPGIALNLGWRGFSQPIYSAYLKAAWTFKKPTIWYDISNRNKYKLGQSVHISGFGYLFNLSLDFVGIGLQVDHYFLNRPAISLGYSVAARCGLQWEGDLTPAVQSMLTLLVGRSPIKFEISGGGNLPLYDPIPYLDQFEFLHAGMGLRIVPDGFPVFMRFGAATTSILYTGLGLHFGGTKAN